MTELTLTEDALFELLATECRVDPDGTARYYNALGQLHRVYGPAIKYADGTLAWCQNAQLHRPDGPAVEWADGTRMWSHKGQLHRLDGPAIERPDGSCDWFINGKELTEAEWQQQVASMEIYA